MNICRLFVEDRKVCLDWCADQGLFKKEIDCKVCRLPMNYDYESGVLGRHRCQRISKHRKVKKGVIEVNISKNTFFYILLIIMCWADMFSYEQTMKHSTFLSGEKL